MAISDSVDHWMCGQTIGLEFGEEVIARQRRSCAVAIRGSVGTNTALVFRRRLQRIPSEGNQSVESIGSNDSEHVYVFEFIDFKFQYYPNG